MSMLTRRTFVKNSTLAIAGATLFSKDLFAGGKDKTITGVQLYSVREEIKKLLGDLGLQMKSGHTTMGEKAWDATKNDFTDLWKYTVEDAATVGQQYVISPWLDDKYRKDLDGLKAFLAVFNKSGELCTK